MLVALIFGLLVGWSAAADAAGWIPVTVLPPDFAGSMLLLSDGRVVVQGYSPGDNWMVLTPSPTGSYISGTWTTTAPMSIPRLYFASHVLQNGNLWVLGGEYTGNPFSAVWSNTGEMYDTLTNTWSPIASHPEANYGDVPSMLMPGGKILAGSLLTRNTYLYDIASNSWGPPISKVVTNDDSSDEETWVKLADGKVLTCDLFKSIATLGAYAEVFDPVTNTWSSISPSDGSALGAIPQLSSVAVGYEIGPALRLQDGRIFLIGATQHTAFYTPSTNTWSAGPDIPSHGGVLYGATDAPAAILPNGNVLFAASPLSPLFGIPTKLFEFNPATNSMSTLSVPAALSGQLDVVPCFVTRMLILPTGQVLLVNNFNQLWVYTPNGQVNFGVRPVISSIVNNGGGNFTLTGKQLNGQSAESSYGDDAESDENFPIVRVRSATTGLVYYTRTTNWSSTGVGPGPGTVDFKTPAGMPSGSYSVFAIGAGISSYPKALSIL